jgi:hypothetical protein
MGTRYCILTRITAAFTILLFLSGSFIQTTYAKKIEVNQIGEKQSIILMDGLEIRVPTPYIFVERNLCEKIFVRWNRTYITNCAIF